MPLFITVNGHARSALVVGEYLALAPRLVVIRNHAVLREADSLVLGIDRSPALRVLEFQRGVMFQHLVCAGGWREFREQSPGDGEDVLGVDDFEQQADNAGESNF